MPPAGSQTSCPSISTSIGSSQPSPPNSSMSRACGIAAARTRRRPVLAQPLDEEAQLEPGVHEKREPERDHALEPRAEEPRDEQSNRGDSDAPRGRHGDPVHADNVLRSRVAAALSEP